MFCTTKTLKYIVSVFNLICALLGSALIWYGVWLLNSIETNSIDHGENLASVLIILLGCVVLLAPIFGTVAIFMESKGMLISYAVILLSLLLIQFVLVSVSHAAASDGLPAGLKQGFDELWDQHHEGNSTLTFYEEWLECCGKNSAQDYFDLDKVPTSSCCKDHDCTNVFNLFVVGCEPKFREYVNIKTANFNLISWLLIITELGASIATCYLIDSIRNHRDRVRFYG